jgi:hypothetical protein
MKESVTLWADRDVVDVVTGLSLRTRYSNHSPRKYTAITHIVVVLLVLACISLAMFGTKLPFYASYEIITPLSRLDEQGNRLLIATLDEIKALTNP